MVLDAEDRQARVAQAFEGLSLRLTWLGSTSAGRVAGSTAKPWFWVVISTLPVALVADRVVGAAVAELELEGLARRRPGRGAGGPGRCRRSACRATRRPCGSGCGGSPIASPRAAGSPGPLERKMPSGWCSRIASAGVDAGDDRHPAAALDQVAGDVPLHAEVERDDVRATSGRRRGRRRARSDRRRARRSRGSQTVGPSGMTSRARSRPTRPGLARALSTRRASSRSVVERIPFIAPWIAGQADQGPGVDPLDAEDAVLLQVVVRATRSRGSC